MWFNARLATNSTIVADGLKTKKVITSIVAGAAKVATCSAATNASSRFAKNASSATSAAQRRK